MTSTVTDEVGPRPPYPGPRPFEPGEEDLFFGREVESANLVSLVVARRTLVLYAESGAGKTSLLNASAIPALRARGMDVLPAGRVGGEDGSTVAGGGNVYVRNLLSAWASPDDTTAVPDTDSIAGCLSRLPRSRTPEGEAVARVVLLDQFEELFTLYPDRWHDREDFLAQVQDALDADPLVRVIFSLRADYVSRFDTYGRLFSDGLRCRFHLERLREPAALDAVGRPLLRSTRRFEPGAAEALVQSLLEITVQRPDGATESVPGEFVEPVQLQIVCKNLWDRLPPAVDRITRADVDTYAEVGDALARFYREALDRVVTETGLDEVDLRGWFSKELITPAGTRGMAFRGQETTRNIPNRAVELLEDLHMIRLESRSGSRWYELSHDLFIRAIELDNLRRSEEVARAAEAARAAATARRRRVMARLMVAAGIVAAVFVGLIAALIGYREQAADTTNQVKAQAQQQKGDLNTALNARSAALQALGLQGTILFSSNRDGPEQIYQINADGSGERRLSVGGQDDRLPTATRDGKRIAFRRKVNDKDEVWVMNADGSGAAPLARSDDNSTFPAWSPDGTQVAFQRNRPGNNQPYDIHVINADGTGERSLAPDPADDEFPAWSPDGTRIAFQSSRADGVPHIWVMDAGGSNPKRLTQDPKIEFNPVWSPDGKRIAFQSNREGNNEIYLVNANGTGLVQITSTLANDGSPAWSPDGVRIVFRSDRDGNDQIYVMRPDGSDVTRLTLTSARERNPHWIGS